MPYLNIDICMLCYGRSFWQIRFQAIGKLWKPHVPLMTSRGILFSGKLVSVRHMNVYLQGVQKATNTIDAPCSTYHVDVIYSQQKEEKKNCPNLLISIVPLIYFSYTEGQITHFTQRQGKSAQNWAVWAFYQDPNNDRKLSYMLQNPLSYF